VHEHYFRRLVSENLFIEGGIVIDFGGGVGEIFSAQALGGGCVIFLEHFHIGDVEEVVGTFHGAEGVVISALGDEGGDGVVLFFGVAGVKHGVTEIFGFTSCRGHQSGECGLTFCDFLFDFFDGTVLEIHMRIGVIPEVESVCDPVLQDARAGGAIEFFADELFDYEAGYGDVVFCECRQETIVDGVGGIVGEIEEWAGVGKVVDGDGYGAGWGGWSGWD